MNKKRIAKNNEESKISKMGTIDWEMEHLLPTLRSIIELHLEATMRKELENLLCYAEYERKPEGVTNERNGSYQRSLMTRLGNLNINIPRDRQGKFQTQVVGRYQKRENKVNRLILELFIGGISTRKLKKTTRTLLGKGYSAGTISQINKSLTEEMKEWFYGPIQDDIVVIFIDGVNLPVRRFHVSRESLLVALGITKDGRRRILGVSLGERESAKSWFEFFSSLKKRGFKGATLKLGVMDGLAGLEKAFEEAFPRALIQRCVFHKLSNIVVKLPKSIQVECIAQLKRVFYAGSESDARERADIWKERWQKTAPSAVECLFKDLEAVLTFYKFPKSIHRSIRTTNIIERLFKEFKRRTRAMDSFPNEECVLRCIYGISRNLDETWQKIRLWRKNPFDDSPSEGNLISGVSKHGEVDLQGSNKVLERFRNDENQKIPGEKEIALIG